jgi:hypothetical protein
MERNEIVAELRRLRDLLDRRDQAGNVDEMDELSTEASALIESLVEDLSS